MPPPNPLNLTMTPDVYCGLASTIGPAAGTFSSKGANGDFFTLTIPEGALFTDSRISILPMATAKGLHQGAGPFPGVVLLPVGPELAKTGWPKITPSTPIPPENRALWGFYRMATTPKIITDLACDRDKTSYRIRAR